MHSSPRIYLSVSSSKQSYVITLIKHRAVHHHDYIRKQHCSSLEYLNCKALSANSYCYDQIYTTPSSTLRLPGTTVPSIPGPPSHSHALFALTSQLPANIPDSLIYCCSRLAILWVYIRYYLLRSRVVTASSPLLFLHVHVRIAL